MSNQLGSYYQFTASYEYSTNLSFGLYAGLLNPGKALTTNKDNATEVFWEAKLSF